MDEEAALATTVIAVSADKPQAEAIGRAVDLLRAGRLVVFPTETVYGLGGHALDPAAVARIFAAKGRPASNPLIVHVGTIDQARSLAGDWPDVASLLVQRFWPGPLTLVLPRAASVPDAVTAGGPTVALRMPAHPVALALLKAAALPVAAPSANRSSRLSPTRADHVLQDLEGIELILDAGPTPGGIESTVLDLSVRAPRLLRPGLISPEAIEAAIGPVNHSRYEVNPEHAAPSPGLQHRHYAPLTHLEAVEGDGQERVAQLLTDGLRVGWLSLRPTDLDHAALTFIEMSADPAGYAARLYDVLHELDRAKLDCIIVDLPPSTAAWLAVRDRLQRASAPI